MIGATIKDFVVTAPLGRGGMGEVWVAEQQIVKTRVAIKLLAAGVSADQSQVQRFFNEAVAVSRIKHAGIVKIFDVGFHDGRAFLIMELLEGEPLAARLRRGALPAGQVLELGRQVSSVLAATHAAGITHRDLKPDNIFLVADAELPGGERVKVLDFGIAKLGAGPTLTLESSSMGTPGYMAPEQWVDASKADARADVYSLGCIVFEMACRRPPFVAGSLPEACTKHLQEIPPRIATLVPGTPQPLDDLVAAMLAKEPAARPDAVAVNATLSSLLDVRPSAAHAASVPVPSASFPGPSTTLGGAATALPASVSPPRRRWGVVVLGVLGGALACFVALAAIGWNDVDDDAVATATGSAAARTVADAAIVARAPTLGLAAIERFRVPAPADLDELRSATLWTNARDDLAAACAQPGALVRWCAAAELAAGEIATLKLDTDTALAAFRKATAVEPGWAVPYVAVAAALSDRRDLDGALAAARTAQRLDPAWWQAVAAGGRALAAARKLDDAIAEYRRALALAPKDAVLLSEVALLYHAAGMDDAADRYADQALAVDDSLVAVHVMRAERALERGDAETATKAAERVLMVSPRNAAGHLALGDARALRGDRDGAYAEYGKALELVGDHNTGVPEERLAQVKRAMAARTLPEPRGARGGRTAPGAPVRTAPAAPPPRTAPTKPPNNPVDFSL